MTGSKKEVPITLTERDVRLILDGKKTQARRIISATREFYDTNEVIELDEARGIAKASYRGLRAKSEPPVTIVSPFGGVGTTLWGRETHYIGGWENPPWGGLPFAREPGGRRMAFYREGFDRSAPSMWRSATSMPRWASRILLTVEDLRIERLQSITETDAMAEGCTPPFTPGGANLPYTCEFATQWDKASRRNNSALFGSGSWSENPWVWRISFRLNQPGEQT